VGLSKGRIGLKEILFQFDIPFFKGIMPINEPVGG
jgi:hypothetical protein